MAAIKVYESVNLDVNKPVNKNYKKFKNQKPKANDKTLEDYKKQVSNALSKVGGKYVKFDDLEHTEGLMVAGIIDESIVDEISDKDKVCFAIMNRDKKMVYINNNEHFSVLQDIPASLYILDYLYKHEPQTIYDYAEIGMEKDNVEVFTDIYVKIPKKQDKNKNKTNGRK